MKHAHLHIPLSFLVPVLLAAIVVIPVTPELHQALADHDHVLCEEHNRIEDLGIKRSHGLRAGSPSGVEMSFVPPLAGKTPLYETPPCGLSNLHVQSCRPASISPWFWLARVPMGTTRSPSLEIPPRDPLIVAPKHSPPASFSN